MPRSLDRCPLCERDLVPFLERSGFSKCVACELIIRDPLPSEGELQELYEQSWQSPLQHRGETGGTDGFIGRAYALNLAQSLGVKSFDSAKILDFGAGRGDMMDALSQLGADVYGIEPFGWELLKSKGFKIFRTLSDLPSELQFDGIVTIDVVEHLLAPRDVICRLQNLLNRDGWLFIATANMEGLSARIFGPRYRELLKPGHLTFFTISGFERLLALCGFVRYQRLKWLVPYSRNPVRRLLHYGLQLTGLESELRYIAWHLDDLCVR